MAIGNSVNDEIREQQKRVWAEKSFPEKWNYFFHYYKWPALAVIVGVYVSIHLIIGFITQKDTVLQVIYVNAFPNVEDAEFMVGFEEKIGLDTNTEKAILDSSFYIDPAEMNSFHKQNEERIIVMSSAATLDVCVADEDYFEILATEGALANLSTILTEEQMEQYKDYFYYCDSEFDDIEGEVPVGIDVSQAPKIQNTQSYPNDTAYMGIFYSAPNPDNSLAFLDYLYTP